MNYLKNALTVNSIFSGISGIVLTILNKQIAHIFGTENSTVFLIIGIALIYFSITIWYERIKQRKLAVIWIVIQDFLWVIGSAVLLLLKPFQISQTGNGIIAIIAVIVLFMGVNQTIALSKKNKSRTI